MCIGAFHYQSDQFKDIAPPTFGATANIQEHEVTGRHRDFPWLTTAEAKKNSNLSGASVLKRAAFVSTKSDAASLHETTEPVRQGKNIYSYGDIESQNHEHSGTIPIPIRFQDQFLAFSADEESNSFGSSREESEKRQQLMLHRKARGSRNVTKTLRSKMPTPSLFMQETAHLMSLLSAVALSTLRNDVDQAASPVVPYFPNSPWPAVDPDSLPEKVKGKYGEANAFWRVTYFCLGLSRSKKRRTLYNAARPFGVLGGVSDEEIRLLQQARGPYAKVALVTLWLQEYLSREYLAGSTGKVHPPIISRLYQFIRYVPSNSITESYAWGILPSLLSSCSDGMLGYNQARKIAYIPFPVRQIFNHCCSFVANNLFQFPNGQITAFFSLAVIFVFPFLYGGFVTKLWFSCTMNFLTVLCFLGLHEVARELENPFRNVPNDLPLLTYQAQFNEALVT